MMRWKWKIGLWVLLVEGCFYAPMGAPGGETSAGETGLASGGASTSEVITETGTPTSGTTHSSDRPVIACIDDSGSIQDGFIGVAYSFQVSAPGGPTPYQWSATGLPDGLMLTSDGAGSITGTITGVPLTKGVYSVHVSVTDAEQVVTDVHCGDLMISDPIAVDVEALLAAFPDGCVPLGASLKDLRAKNIINGGDDTPITCELRAGSGMGSGTFTGREETMPPGIELAVDTCTVGGVVSSSLPLGIYAFITTFHQSGVEIFVPYCAPQVVAPVTAYQVVREDAGVLATFKPGFVVRGAEQPLVYGNDTPDPKVTITDDIGACPGNTCFYAFVFRYNSLSDSASVNANPNAKFPAQGFDGFTHGINIADADPSLFDSFRGRPFVVNMQLDYCIADNGDDCGNNEADSAKRAALVRQNGGGSAYYFSLVALPKP